MYAVYLRFIEKRGVDFLLLIMELLSLGITADGLRRYEQISIKMLEAKISKIAKISGEIGRLSPTILPVRKPHEWKFYMV